MNLFCQNRRRHNNQIGAYDELGKYYWLGVEMATMAMSILQNETLATGLLMHVEHVFVNNIDNRILNGQILLNDNVARDYSRARTTNSVSL